MHFHRLLFFYPDLSLSEHTSFSKVKASVTSINYSQRESYATAHAQEIKGRNMSMSALIKLFSIGSL